MHGVTVIQNCLFAVEQRPVHRACDRSTALVSSYVVADEMLFQVAYAVKFPVPLVKGSLSVAAVKVALRGLALQTTPSAQLASQASKALVSGGALGSGSHLVYAQEPLAH